MLFYRSSLPLSRSTLNYLTGLVRRNRVKLGSKGRALTAGQQALMVLAYLKKPARAQRPLDRSHAAGIRLPSRTRARALEAVVQVLQEA
ncbi:hypothetical protein [Actinocorallia lasiicapitis]